jgi:hypothetical protein
MAQRGWGWSYTNWYGFAGIACGWPLVKDTVYTQVGEHKLYMDETMTGIFRKINGVQ